jgi:hypothetical protein
VEKSEAEAGGEVGGKPVSFFLGTYYMSYIVASSTCDYLVCDISSV